MGFTETQDKSAFLAQAKTNGWRAALKSVGLHKVCEAAAPNRLAWLKLVHLTPESKVLDIGAGTGGIACQLAEFCHIEAVDVSTVDIEFLNIRAKQDQLHHFHAQVASATSLPFPDNHFDLVTLNGVLEWIPIENTQVHPKETQLKGLREIRRVLKDQGKLLLGIENGKALRYFLGVTEPHTDLSYVSLLPEKKAEALSQGIRGKSFLERTYSLRETEDLLIQGGFSHVESYWSYPNYRLPEALVPLSHSGAIQYFVEHLLSPSRIASQSQFVQYLFYRFNDPTIIRDFVGNYCFLCW